jgi:hypothetical protein
MVRSLRRMISLRMPASCSATNKSVNAISMTINGTRIVG